MSIITAGLLISFSGIVVVCLGLFDVLPNAGTTLNYVFIGIGWVFILIGIVVRIIGMKVEKKHTR
ncbi:hypothetical protein CSE16_06940 [Solibacillus sp. R5-41]|uniref:hypothetical protein n=1 Tax=Solibacillus sp. R5-41 TaxID=2048654 RepID=UPI0007170829|nr:hypothetical protein [Solibacillus sp. R5-41]ATP39809.1 hypothetical protein CSE16_06940 [Solibacillus sp. R5-41]